MLKKAVGQRQRLGHPSAVEVETGHGQSQRQRSFEKRHRGTSVAAVAGNDDQNPGWFEASGSGQRPEKRSDERGVSTAGKGKLLVRASNLSLLEPSLRNGLLRSGRLGAECLLCEVAEH